MNAETQIFAEPDYSSVANYAARTSLLATHTKASVLCLTTMFEQLWMFYEAMRLGKPLPDAELKLAHLKGAVRLMIKRD